MTKFEKLLGAGGKDVLAKRAKNLAGITSIEVTSKVNELQKNILMLEAKINDLTDLSGETSYDLRPGGKDFNPTKWLETLLKTRLDLRIKKIEFEEAEAILKEWFEESKESKTTKEDK